MAFEDFRDRFQVWQSVAFRKNDFVTILTAFPLIFERRRNAVRLRSHPPHDANPHTNMTCT